MKAKGIIEKNVNALTKSKKAFVSYVKKSYSRKRDFPNSSFYFHKRVLEMIRASKNYRDLLNDKTFLEFVYATLATWGMDRMDGSARLVKFDVFRNSVFNNLALLEELTKYKMDRLSDPEKQKAKDKLAILLYGLNVMVGKCKLVGVSKALHHLLPDLVMPIDGTYSLKFYYGNTTYNENNQKEKFLEIFNKFCFIAKKLNLSKKDLTGQWDTSIPKLIDNAIIGFVSDKNK